MNKNACKIYLFDWGDTLMVDFPEQEGSMCEWKEVQACLGAKEALEYLSKEYKIYIATGAGVSTQSQIKKAFDRVELSHYIDGYFCKNNVGLEKGTPEFLKAILVRLHVKPEEVIMVGDKLDKDIKPALALGMNGVWLSDEVVTHTPPNLRIIKTLYELIN